MKRASLWIALIVSLGFASAVLAPTASAASGELAGTWTSVDSDGSNQTLDIMGSGNQVYSMIYFDESATSACDGDPARVSGPGFVDGNDLVMVGTVVCLPGGNQFRSRFDISYDYDAGTDTLTDAFGIVWHRAN
jgi:hypothetical protein